MNGSLKHYLYLIVSAAIWGGAFVVSKYAYRTVDSFCVIYFRFLIAAILCLPTAWKERQLLNNKKILYPLLLISVLFMPGTFLLQYIGLQYTSVSYAAIIMAFVPLIIVFMGYFFWNQTLTLRVIVASVSSLIGVAIIVGFSEKINYWGCAIVFLSTPFAAFWVRYSKTILEEMSATTYTALIIVLCTLVLTPLLYFSHTHIQSISLPVWMAIIYLGVGCTWLANWFWNAGLAKTEMNKSGLFLSLEPVFGVMLGIIVLHESLSWAIFIGSMLVFSPLVYIAYLDFKTTA